MDKPSPKTRRGVNLALSEKAGRRFLVAKNGKFAKTIATTESGSVNCCRSRD